MTDLKIGDRVRVISVPDLSEWEAKGVKIRIGMMGTVKVIDKNGVWLEFDHYMGGHGGFWGGEYGHCWWLEYEYLEKIEDIDERMDTNKEMVNHPPHYTAGKVECIDAIESVTCDLTGIEAVCTANIIKYVWRWKLKNGVEDLEKASWYLHKLIEKKKDDKYKDEIRKSSIFKNNAP